MNNLVRAVVKIKEILNKRKLACLLKKKQGIEDISAPDYKSDNIKLEIMEMDANIKQNSIFITLCYFGKAYAAIFTIKSCKNTYILLFNSHENHVQ